MTTIDSHQHFWNYDAQKHSWMSDDMVTIKTDFTPEMLKKELDANNMDGCVAVQADQTEAETEFLVDLAAKNPFIKGVVGWVDLRNENISDRLAHFSNDKVIKGFRHVVQAEPDPDFMLGADFQRGIKALSNFGFTYDILIFPNQLPAAIKLASNFPNQAFVLDHIAKPYIKRGDIAGWEADLRALGALPNVYCKISGMVTEADWAGWKYDDFEPYLNVVLEAFTSNRIMYGSDWPVCLVSTEYRKMKAIVDRFISALSANEQAQIMGGNAIKFYGLNELY